MAELEVKREFLNHLAHLSGKLKDLPFGVLISISDDGDLEAASFGLSKEDLVGLLRTFADMIENEE